MCASLKAIVLSLFERGQFGETRHQDFFLFFWRELKSKSCAHKLLTLNSWLRWSTDHSLNKAEDIFSTQTHFITLFWESKGTKLWHFDWLCYLRLLGECRTFFNGVTKRGQSAEVKKEVDDTHLVTTEFGGDKNNNNNIDTRHYINERLTISNAGPSNMDTEHIKKMANDISDHLANNLNLSYPSSSTGDANNGVTNFTNKLNKNGPMSSADFRRHGKQMVDYIADYLESIHTRRVTPNVEPGYMKNYLPEAAPMKAESWETIMEDFEKIIMPGVTHWQHPRFHAYFPAGNSFPSILADMVTDAIGCVGFSWAASPACTELEIIMLDWVAKIIGLPEEFLCLSDHSSKGGGVIQVTCLNLMFEILF